VLTFLHRRRRDERGATIVIFCLVLIGLLVTAGIVLDFGLVRSDRTQNKGAADVSVAAGMRSLELAGYPAPFRGVCGAVAYLKANHPQLSGLTTASHFTKGNGAPTASTDPCTTAAPEQSQLCLPSDTSTWATYQQTIGGLAVTIKNGYDLNEGGYPDETLVAGADPGSTDLGNCDHLAVMITETAQPGFGRVAYGGSLTTRIRSVGRVTQSFDVQALIALLLLERDDCRVLSFSGTNSRVVVKGHLDRPGIIHADSIASSSGANCTSSQILAGNAATTPDGVAGPSILAKQAETGSPPKPGQISVSALSGIPGSTPEKAATACPSTVLGEPSSCVTGQSRKGRAPVDALYRTRIVALQSLAATQTAWTNAQATANGFVVKSCPSGIVTEQRVFVDCSNFNNSATFTANDAEVIFNGKISVGTPLTFVNPRSVYVRDRVTLSGASDLLSINAGASANCTDRFTADRSKSTKFVVLGGQLSASGGTARMCQTMVLLGNGTIPTSNGAAPYNNSFSGNIGLSGGGGFDWTAPNETNNTMEPTDTNDIPFLDHFENLALWTETESGNSLSGGGTNVMSGVFFLPNANEFTINGGAEQAIERDAQFITRKLKLTGNGYLTMKPNPDDSISFPYFSSFSLVR